MNQYFSSEQLDQLKQMPVALLFGGYSHEREVSIMSANSIYQALNSLGYNITKLDVREYNLTNLKKDGYQVAFNILHGGEGENGVVQSVIQYIDIPCTGCTAEQAAVTFNKAFTKDVWNNAMLPVANYVALLKKQVSEESVNEIYDHLQKDGVVFVKPARDGSSIGISKVKQREDLNRAVSLALAHDDMILIEEPITDGKEYSVSMFNGKALEPAEIIYQSEFYDYDAKYVSDTTKVEIPAKLDPQMREKMMNLAQDAVLTLGITGWCRVDMLSDANDDLYLVEVNTVPGMTSHSIFPGSMLDKTYAQVCEIILASAVFPVSED